jgi:hypothetical protein
VYALLITDGIVLGLTRSERVRWILIAILPFLAFWLGALWFLAAFPEVSLFSVAAKRIGLRAGESGSKDILEYQKSMTPMIRSLEVRIGEVSKKMGSIVNALETRIDLYELKARDDELKDQRDELELSLDEEKLRNLTMTEEDMRLALMRIRGMPLNSLEEKRTLVNLLINSIVLYDAGTTDSLRLPGEGAQSALFLLLVVHDGALVHRTKKTNPRRSGFFCR